MWVDPEADGCIYDTVDCYHDCKGCMYGPPEFYKPEIKGTEPMDNRQFNVNGRGQETLLQTLQLAFVIDRRVATCLGWYNHPTHGLLLIEYGNSEIISEFPSPLSADEVYPIVWTWLKSPAAAAVPLSGWNADADHDGHNDRGWRVYVEDWGGVAGKGGIICAITPSYLWYGR